MAIVRFDSGSEHQRQIVRRRSTAIRCDEIALGSKVRKCSQEKPQVGNDVSRQRPGFDLGAGIGKEQTNGSGSTMHRCHDLSGYFAKVLK